MLDPTALLRSASVAGGRRVPARVVAALAALAVAAAGCTTVEGPGVRAATPPPAVPAGDGAANGAAQPVAPEQAEAERRRRAGIRLELAAGYYQQGALAQALDEIRQALAIDPGYAPAYGVLGLVYMSLNDAARADESFRQGLKLAPEDSDLNNNYGWFLCRSGRSKESIAHFATAVKNPLYPAAAKALHNAGICSRLAGDEAAAEQYFKRSFEVDPSNPVAMYNLGEIFLKRGDLERARFHSQRLTKAYEPTAETLWLAIRVERAAAGDSAEFDSLSSQLRRRFPDSREARLLQRGAFGE